VTHLYQQIHGSEATCYNGMHVNIATIADSPVCTMSSPQGEHDHGL